MSEPTGPSALPSEVAPPETVPRAAELPPDTSQVAADTNAETAVEPAPLAPTSVQLGGGGSPPPSDSGSGGHGGDGDDGEEHMTKMSFLEHLEELRQRITRSLFAIAGGFLVCLTFADRILKDISRPIILAQRQLHQTEGMYFSHPIGAFDIKIKIALVCGLFLSAPFVVYQLWAFIAPGLYKRERRYAVPFVVVCSSLFIAGGAFGYFVAFPTALKFLLGLGTDQLKPLIMIDEYLSLFMMLILGLAVVFELPVLIMILSLLRVVSPAFLLRNFRYAVLVITIIAAIVTPSDVMSMMMVEIPMLALYLLGIFFAWLVVRHRDKEAKAS